MFELIDPDALAVDEPVADWLGKRLIANAEALAERGWAGSYVWSDAEPDNESIPVLSTHPNYWYAVPIVIRSSPQQQTITLIAQAVVSGGVDLCLWVDGVTSAEVAATTGANTLTLTLPAQPGVSIPLRAALLIRSELGDVRDSGTVDGTGTYSISAAGVPYGSRAPHEAIVLSNSGTGSAVWSTYAGETTYHVIRADGTLAYLWPSLDPVINARGGTGGTLVTAHFVGTIELQSIHIYTGDARPQTLPYPSNTNAGEPVRAETLARVTEYSRRTLTTSQQIAWLGGVGGTLRSGQSAEARWWGAFFRRRLTDLPYVSTVIRARDSVAGIRVSVLYASEGRAELAIDVDGTVTRVDLDPSGSTDDRWTPGASGMLAYTLASRIGLDGCSSQDLSFHGPTPQSSSPDIRRFQLASTLIPWPAPAPSVGDLVPVSVGLGGVNEAGIYIAAILIEEAPAADYGTFDPVVDVSPFRDITDTQADALYGRQTYLYGYAVRCMYSEAADPLVTLPQSAGVQPITSLTVRTSPDLPSGTVLRFTIDADDIDIGGSVTLSFTGRSVQTADLAVSSDTVYALTITGDANQITGSGFVYLLRIEEITP